MDSRIASLGVIFLTIGLILEGFFVSYALNPHGDYTFYAYSFEIGGTLIAIGITLFLTGLFRLNSSQPLDRRELIKGIVLVIIAYPVTYLIFAVNEFISRANSFGINEEPWHNLGYAIMGYYFLLLLIPVLSFAIGCFYIYDSKSCAHQKNYHS